MELFRLALFLLIVKGVAAQLQLQPQNVTALRGSQARFNCSTTQSQPVMTLLHKGLLVVTILQSSVEISNQRYSARNLTTPGDYKWEFIISNIERDDAGQVTCQVLGVEARSSSLSVQVPKPNTRDQTILIAVTVAFSAAALLFLLIVLIIICCKRRKEKRTSYEEEVRRARLSHHRSPTTRGRDNRGYVTDGRHGGDHNGGVWHTNYSHRQPMSYPPDDFFENGPRNHRHMTMV